MNLASGMEYREAKWQVSAHTAREWQTRPARSRLSSRLVSTVNPLSTEFTDMSRGGGCTFWKEQKVKKKGGSAASLIVLTTLKNILC